MKKKNIILWVLLTIIALATAGGVFAALMPGRFINFNVVITAVIVGLHSLGILIFMGLSRGKHQRTLAVSSVSLIISMTIFLFEVWGRGLFHWRVHDTISNVGAIFLFFGIMLGHRLLIAPMQVSIFAAKLSQRTALISAVALFVISSFGLLTDGYGPYEDIAVRVILVCGLILVGSTIACAAFSVLGPRPEDDEPGVLTGGISVAITCPRCESHCSITSNRDERCPECKLKLHITVEEPRCSCGYLLYQLDSDVCPECGKTLDPEDRWSPPDQAMPSLA